jgi:hypothetical protein
MSQSSNRVKQNKNLPVKSKTRKKNQPSGESASAQRGGPARRIRILQYVDDQDEPAGAAGRCGRRPS